MAEYWCALDRLGAQRKVAIALKLAAHKLSSVNTNRFSASWFHKETDAGVGEARRKFGLWWKRQVPEEPEFSAYEIDAIFRWLEARPVKHDRSTTETELWFAGSPMEVLSDGQGGSEGLDFEDDLEKLLRKKFLSRISYQQVGFRNFVTCH